MTTPAGSSSGAQTRRRAGASTRGMMTPRTAGRAAPAATGRHAPSSGSTRTAWRRDNRRCAAAICVRNCATCVRAIMPAVRSTCVRRRVNALGASPSRLTPLTARCDFFAWASGSGSVPRARPPPAAPSTRRTPGTRRTSGQRRTRRTSKGKGKDVCYRCQQEGHWASAWYVWRHCFTHAELTLQPDQAAIAIGYLQDISYAYARPKAEPAT